MVACAPSGGLGHVDAMATERKTVEFILEQLTGAGEIAARSMFGEYGLYCDGKMIGIIGDDQLYIKPTRSGRAFAPELAEAAPYPQAKPYQLVEADRWDDQDWMQELTRITTSELAPPRPRTGKKSAGARGT